ncbi:unnamed protein product [Larinioides sclopetarius]|uniref:Uncharacterized protein n=1 Tax=Larinioides sclopetarius TaxID=280406 RepID=A0AAV2AM64_9ARAC
MEFNLPEIPENAVVCLFHFPLLLAVVACLQFMNIFYSNSLHNACFYKFHKSVFIMAFYAYYYMFLFIQYLGLLVYNVFVYTFKCIIYASLSTYFVICYLYFITFHSRLG